MDAGGHVVGAGANRVRDQAPVEGRQQRRVLAARRAGASKREMHAVAGLAYLFRGLTAFNMGAEIIAEIYGDAERS